LTIVCIFAALLIAKFYGARRLRLLTVGLAFNFILWSLNIVQYALLHKSLDFWSRFWIETVAISISGIAALMLTGAGVRSLAGRFAKTPSGPQ
jgi:hypothetical protein